MWGRARSVAMAHVSWSLGEGGGGGDAARTHEKSLTQLSPRVIGPCRKLVMGRISLSL